jgi:hypothetical protein
MQRHVTPNTCHATCGQFAGPTLNFLRGKSPRTGEAFVIRSPTTSASSTQGIFGFRVTALAGGPDLYGGWRADVGLGAGHE